MKKPPVPVREQERLDKLYSYLVLDTDEETIFDSLTEMAATIFNVPIALVSLVDEHRQWFKSKIGLDVCETSRDVAFCAHAIIGNDLFIVEDTFKDARFSANPLVLDGPQIRFYAGMPLITPDGFKVGTFCVIDNKPRQLDESQKKLLKVLAQNVIEILELKKSNIDKARLQRDIDELQSMTLSGSWELDVLSGKTRWSSGVYQIYGLPSGVDTNMAQGISNYTPEGQEKLERYINTAISQVVSFDDVFEFLDHNKVKKWVRSIGRPVISDDGSVKKIVGTFQDVTDHIEAIRAVELSTQILEVEQEILLIASEQVALEEKLDRCLDLMLDISWLESTFQGAIYLQIDDACKLQLYTQKSRSELSSLYGSESQLCLRAARERKTNYHVFVLENDKNNLGFEGTVYQYAVPIFYGDEVLGVISLYHDNEKQLIEDKVHWLERISSIIGVLIKSSQNTIKLQKSENTLSLALEGASIGIWDWTLADNSVWFDKRWADMLGICYDTVEMNLSTWSSRVHPDDLERCYSDIQNYLSGNTSSYENVHRMKHENGHWVYILDKGKISHRNDQGEPIKFTGTHLDITSMMRNKEKLDLFFNKAPFGFAFCDLNGDFLDINNEMTKITGYELNELKKLSYWDLTPDSYAEEEEKQLKSVLDKGFYGPFQKEYIRKDGSKIPVELHGFIVDDYDGKRGIWSIIQDITEKSMLNKEKEILLDSYVDTTQKLEAIFRFSPVVVYECSINSNWTMSFINSHIEAISGYSSADLINDSTISFSSLIHPDDTSFVSETVYSCLEKGVSHELTYRIIHRDGSIRWVWERGSRPPEKDVLVGVIFDITQRKREEEIIHLNTIVRSKYIDHSVSKKEFSDFLLEKILLGMNSEYGFIGEVLEDISGQYLKTYALTDISWNEETKKFYDEYAPDGLEFRNLETLFGEVILKGEPVITNDPSSHPASYGVPKGHPPLNSFMGIPLFYNNQLVAMIGVANRKEGYDQSLYNLFKPFFELCGELIKNYKLSKELEEQKVISQHSSKLASIGELAAGIGHEINNPLAILNGQIEMLQDHLQKREILDDTVVQRIEKAQLSVRRIASIVKGLGSMSRIDSKEFVSFNFTEMLRETFEMLKDIYRSEGLNVQVDLEDGLFVQGVRGRLQQVIVNLLNNAKDAVLNSTKKNISLSAKKAGDHIQVVVMDSGPGVPEAFKYKIFEPFFTTKGVNKGTGIGLSIVDSIVKEHHGVIKLDSSFKGGACFIVSLKSSSSPVVEEAIDTIQSSTFKGRVLIVDDEEGIRELLTDVLEDAGLSVTGFSDAASALEHLMVDYDYSLIISDIKMPGMNGIEFAKSVRQKAKFAGGLLLITGGTEFSVEECKKEIDGLIFKPFSRVDLLALVDTVIKKKQ